MIPMVQQGSDGKFNVLAKGEPEIYINNKKVRDPSELKQLKSVDIPHKVKAGMSIRKASYQRLTTR